MSRAAAWENRLVELSTDLILVVDFDAVILEANPGAKDVLGYSADELRGMELFSLVHPDDLPATIQSFEHVQTGQLEMNFVNRFRTKSGSYRWINWNVVPDMPNKMNYAVGRDVTEQRQDHLTARQLGSDFDREAKLASLRVMAAGVAHDFNNVFTSILGYLKLLSVKTTGEVTWRYDIEEIRRLTEQASTLSYQLLSYAGLVWSAKEQVDINELLGEMSPELEFTVSKNVNLVVESGEDLPEIAADVNQMRQVVLNLLVNAVEVIGEEPGNVTIKTGKVTAGKGFWRAPELRGAGDTGEYITITVIDDGPGIEPALQGRVFDPFFTTKPLGRGLGLAQVLGIVRAHHGVVMVESKEGHTKFQVILPCSDAESPRPRITREECATGQGSTILVVDDEVSICDVVGYVLSNAGYEVRKAKNGMEALEVFTEEGLAIDLALIDFRMPCLNGFETSTKLREMKAGLPIIMASGYPRDIVPDDFFSMPCTAFLQKPFKPEELLKLIEEMLGDAESAASASPQ
ncbi:MAG: response regulator [Candidatus Lernaella stagnicola]|nr:response regulator [Candidatus Lernaella stagnicola]